MTPLRAQKQQQDYSYKYSTEEGKEASGDGFGAADYYTVHYPGSIVPTASQPIQQQRGGKSMTYSITDFGIRPYSYLLGGQKVNSVIRACFAGISTPRIPHTVASEGAAAESAGISTPPLCALLTSAVGFLASADAWAAGSGTGAAVVLSQRELWAAGIGLFGGAVLCWLVAGVVMVLGRLKELFESKPPGVINVTPPDEWELEPKEGESEPAVLVEQPVQPCFCPFCKGQQWKLDCPGRSAAVWPAKQVPNEQ